MRQVVLTCFFVGVVATVPYCSEIVSAEELQKQTRGSKADQPVTLVQSKAAPPMAEVIPPAAVAQGPRMSDDINRLQEQVRELQRQLREAREADRAYVDAWLQHAAQARPSSESRGNAGAPRNMVFFKGGIVRMNSDRAGEIFTDTLGTTARNDGTSGWYGGAGLDMLLTRDAWGAISKTWVTGEIGVQFNRLASKTVTNGATLAALGVIQQNKVQMTMVTINVAPKIKFMEGSAIRPWVIPVGLDIHVISPPSNQTQYLDIGAQFGVGLEIDLSKSFKLGIDARYHLSANMTNTTNSYGQVGPYLGIAF